MALKTHKISSHYERFKMNVEQLIEELSKMSPKTEVMSRDVVAYRELVGPYETQISRDDADNHADCEGREGEIVVVI